MSMSTVVLKLIIKNWHLIKHILKLVPKKYRKKILKKAIKIIYRNKLPFTIENIKKVLQIIIELLNNKENGNGEKYIENIDSYITVDDIQKIEVKAFPEADKEESGLIIIDNPDDIIDLEEYSALPNNDNLKIKIIFLSGEGVIFKSKAGRIDRLTFIEPSFVALKKIIQETGASIIITSSFRKSKGGKMLLEMKFKEYGIDKSLIGYTVETFGMRRKDKIKKKIRDFEDMIDNYVIFDRRTDLGQTLSTGLISCSNGIDRVRMEKSIEILNK